MFQVDQCSDKNSKTFQQREMKINVTVMGGSDNKEDNRGRDSR